MFRTSCYTQETPKFLWDPWTSGPADEHDRYGERINSLIALDTLAHCPGQLGEQERAQAIELAARIQTDELLEVLTDV